MKKKNMNKFICSKCKKENLFSFDTLDSNPNVSLMAIQWIGHDKIRIRWNYICQCKKIEKFIKEIKYPKGHINKKFK